MIPNHQSHGHGSRCFISNQEDDQSCRG
jgi:hypothetical protein